LLGLAASDALETRLEFHSPGSFKPLEEMTGGGPFQLEPGEWTNDTFLAFGLVESSIEYNSFDALDQLGRYDRCLRKGYLSSTGS
jgi:ADP-ribosyl-[dinitrogen reductase] hydrolase